MTGAAAREAASGSSAAFTREQTIRMRLRRFLPSVLILVTVLALPSAALVFGERDQPLPPQTPGFHPGRIIDDEDFYNGQAMTADQVQAFLDRMQPVCADGGQCLARYRTALPEFPASARCAKVPGRPSASAAEIIEVVGRACRISQEVILVILEKEQSLISNAHPDPIRYDRAMGYYCPDDPKRPGWCDPEFGGFARQVYYAAAQFQRYRQEPHKFTYQSGEVEEIAYAPNAPECGSIEVLIENDATAGLYNYTPYAPNEAALDPSSLDGDACSAFGNRNFWRFYNAWFGNPELLGEWAERT